MAGLTMVALAGCAKAAEPQTQRPTAARLLELINEGSDHVAGVRISGIVITPENHPIENALVILRSTVLASPQEIVTNEHGIYSFVNLPPGTYVVEAIAGNAKEDKSATIPEDADIRCNFILDPEPERGKRRTRGQRKQRLD